MRKLLILTVLMILSFGLYAQKRVSINAQRVLMDTTFDKVSDTTVAAIIAFYKPAMEQKMNEVIGKSAYELRNSRPESLLSNFTADALLNYAKSFSKGKVDFSLTNFGGIRASLPAGDVKMYDVYSVFPFENYVVVIDMNGKDVLTLFESFAQNRVEAMSCNTYLEIDNQKLVKATINGEPIDVNRVYRVATIDFLLSGGDNVAPLRLATAVEQTGALIRDAVIAEFRKAASKGTSVAPVIDGRVKISSKQ